MPSKTAVCLFAARTANPRGISPNNPYPSQKLVISSPGVKMKFSTLQAVKKFTTPGRQNYYTLEIKVSSQTRNPKEADHPPHLQHNLR